MLGRKQKWTVQVIGVFDKNVHTYEVECVGKKTARSQARTLWHRDHSGAGIHGAIMEVAITNAEPLPIGPGFGGFGRRSSTDVRPDQSTTESGTPPGGGGTSEVDRPTLSSPGGPANRAERRRQMRERRVR